MENFLNEEDVMKILEETGYKGKENCFFVTFKDTNREGLKYGIGGGITGGLGYFAGSIAGNAIKENMEKGEALKGLYYDGLLINQTEEVLEFFPLQNKGMALMLNPAKMKLNIENRFFVKNEDIQNIIIKNFNIFNSTTKSMKIILKDGQAIYLLVHIKEKAIQYQAENFAKFMKKYDKNK